jgi:hypothetical protein
MTSGISVSPGPGVGARAVRRAPWRSWLDPATTPGRLRQLLILLVLLSLAWGVLATLTAYQHASAAGDVVGISEPLSLDAEQIYENLSDADDTATHGFLSGGLEPAASLQRYNADIAAAAVRIEAATALVGGTAARTQLPARPASTGDDLAILSADLPVYTGEVQTAEADNRTGLPLGSAYLREASALLRGKLLTSANDIYTRENALLTSASAQATGLPLMVITVVVGLGLGYVLFRSWRWLAKRTHRVVNYGLLVALVAGLASIVWLASAFFIGRADLLHAQQHGSAPAEAFARADVVALRMHADESLTLIDNSGDDTFQQDFVSEQKLLGPGTGTLLAAVESPPGAVSADAKAWYRAHSLLRGLDDNGSHPAAVQSALTGAAATQFSRLSAALGNGVTAGQTVFAARARSGRQAFTGLAIAMIVASLVMVTGCVWGLNRRLGEYR